jgi:hypothetical protein
MKADFSRITFRPGPFSAVLLQQGRVLLDADFNEQALIVAEAIRQRTRDLVGPHAAPTGDPGFAIDVAPDRVITIAAGRYYVDGLLAVNPPRPRDETGVVPPLPYDQQFGFPFPDSAEVKWEDGPYLVYLDVWGRPLTWLERPAIREVALGGPDTSIRAQVVWQVRAATLPNAAAAKDVDAWIDVAIRRQPRDTRTDGLMLPAMQAWTDPKDNPDDTPCVADPLGGYSGLENQLYRVEIHEVSSDGREVTFKWSRDNGAVVAAWTAGDGNELTFDGLRDTGGGFTPGQWVEITDEIGQVRNVPGVMARLVKVDRAQLTLDPASLSAALPDRTTLVNPTIRRWDSREVRSQGLVRGAILLKEATDYTLERGIHVGFSPAPGTAKGTVRYRTGDYWLIPARTATADIEWPYQVSTDDQRVWDFREPEGIRHAYAPLAILSLGTDGLPNVKSTRREITQLWKKV